MQSAKNSLRKQIKIKLANLSENEKIKQSENVANILFNHPKFQQSKRISLYLSMKNEIQTPKILKHSLENNKSVFIPKYVGNDMEMVKIESMEDYDSLPETKWKIKQPLDDDNTREEASSSGGLDLIIVPGVGFSVDGLRLGHGKGYYDNYISKIMSIKTPYLIGLAFDVQMCDYIPTSDHDKKLDEVIFTNQ